MAVESSEEEVVWVGGGAVTEPSTAVGLKGAGWMTVTVADFDTCVLFIPVQVSVKVVVVARGWVSYLLPLEERLTRLVGPSPERLQKYAEVGITLQERAVDWPALTVLGSA